MILIVMDSWSDPPGSCHSNPLKLWDVNLNVTLYMSLADLCKSVCFYPKPVVAQGAPAGSLSRLPENHELFLHTAYIDISGSADPDSCNYQKVEPGMTTPQVFSLPWSWVMHVFE